MTTTDTDALTERIRRARSLPAEWARRQDGETTMEQTERWQKRQDEQTAALVAEEVRKAKAEAWDRAYWQGVQDEIDSQGFDGGMTGPNRINPYRETGDSDERR